MSCWLYSHKSYIYFLLSGALTHNQAAHKERATIPDGLLESIVWEDDRSFQVGLTLQGQKMLVVNGFPFVKAMVRVSFVRFFNIIIVLDFRSRLLKQVL